MLQTALSQYGFSEIPGNKSNSRILKYAKSVGAMWYQSDETSWCGIFIGWCAVQSGYQHPMAPQTARNWLKIGEQVIKPQVGDIVVFWREDINSWKGHVGLFIKEDSVNIWVLGGNQGDRVCIKPYPKDRVLEYRRPLRIEV